MSTKSIIISQDLCGVGQVSMGVALPLVAGLGLTPYVLPTALLSSHTGGLGANTYLDLSSEMSGILKHWQQLQLNPDGIYLATWAKALLINGNVGCLSSNLTLSSSIR